MSYPTFQPGELTSPACCVAFNAAITVFPVTSGLLSIACLKSSHLRLLALASSGSQDLARKSFVKTVGRRLEVRERSSVRQTVRKTR